MSETLFFQIDEKHRLAYKTYGLPTGKPMIYFHGTPGSRLEGQALNEAAIKHGYYVIAFDRPGMGLSDFISNRTLLDMPTMTAKLADALGWKQFGVMGLSGGGPQVLACARAIPERLTFAVDMSGAAPVYQSSMRKQLSGKDQIYAMIALKFPWLLRLSFVLLEWLIKKSGPNKLQKLFKKELCKADAKWLEHHSRFFYDDLIESFHQGAKGMSYDAVLIYRNWGFELSDIDYPVKLYHGDQDLFVPYSFGEFKAKHLPNASFTIFPGAGHLSMFEMLDSIFCDISSK
jgi:pimeloyl-ACP methyl ester carboxylesterase